MSIQPYTYSGSTPAFTGNVGKSVYSLLNAVTTHCIKTETKEANKIGTNANKEVIEYYQKLRREILAHLEIYMAQTHPKTVLKYNLLYNRFFLVNNKMNTIIEFGHTLNKKFNKTNKITLNLNDPSKTMHTENKKEWGINFIYNMKEFTKNLSKTYRPEEIDNIMFDNFTKHIITSAKDASVFGKLSANYNGKKADKISLELNKPTIWKDKLKKLHNESVERNKK